VRVRELLSPLLASIREHPAQTNFGEHLRLLKNSLGGRFRPRSGTKHAAFGVFQARFVVVIGSTPTFSTGCSLPGSPVNRLPSEAEAHMGRAEGTIALAPCSESHTGYLRLEQVNFISLVLY
jgi:hypothetical protein